VTDSHHIKSSLRKRGKKREALNRLWNPRKGKRTATPKRKGNCCPSCGGGGGGGEKGRSIRKLVKDNKKRGGAGERRSPPNWVAEEKKKRRKGERRESVSYLNQKKRGKRGASKAKGFSSPAERGKKRTSKPRKRRNWEGGKSDTSVIMTIDGKEEKKAPACQKGESPMNVRKRGNLAGI